MKIRCEKKDLLTAVSNVSRAAPAKSPIPALEGILFETTKDGLKLTAYDTRIGIYTTIESSVFEEGSIVIPARFLLELVRRLPDGLVSIDTDASFSTTIRCGKTEVHVMGIDPESFPELNVVDAIQNISIPESVLKSMITQTIFSVSTSESRPLYMGILFEVGVSDLTLVAVDGYRLAKDIAQWKEAVAERWDAISVVSSEWEVPASGAETGKCYKLRYVIDEKGLDDAVGLELVNVSTDPNGEEHVFSKMPLEVVGRDGNNYVFEGVIEPNNAGIFKSAVRMYPKNDKLPHRQDFCYVKWIELPA